MSKHPKSHPKHEPKNTTAWIHCFVGWLTARKKVIKVGASEDCAIFGELIEQYRVEKGLPEAQWGRLDGGGGA